MGKMVKNHNFGYGTSVGEHLDSKVNKLQLRNVKDLKDYLKDLITSQDENAKVVGNTIKKQDFSDIKIQITIEKDWD